MFLPVKIACYHLFLKSIFSIQRAYDPIKVDIAKEICRHPYGQTLGLFLIPYGETS